jgi:uncharacterized protein (TIGR03437 family)
MIRGLLLGFSLISLWAPAWAQPRVTAVTNAGAFQANLAPGSLAAVFGPNLGPATAQTGAAPGLSIAVNGTPAFIFFSSERQVNIQIPFELAPGNATLTLTYQGVQAAPFAFTLLPFAPALFGLGAAGTGVGVFQHAGGTVVSGAAPAQPGETIVTYVTGLGPTTPAVRTGQITPGTPLATTNTLPVITVGGKPAAVRFAGLAPGAIGSYQVNFTLPADLTPGLYPVVITQGTVPSSSVMIQVGVVGIIVDRTGITFNAVQNGPAPPAVTINAYNSTGRNTTVINAAASTTTGGSWLSATPGSASVGITGGAFRISANPSGLAPGNYYGQIRFTSADAVNSPVLATIVLQVAPPNAPPPPSVDPQGLTFIGLTGASTPATQSITINNVGLSAAAFSLNFATTTSPNPFSSNNTATSVASGQSLTVSVRASATGLAAGTYRGTLTVNFPQLNASRTVDLLFIVTSQTGTASAPNFKTWENRRETPGNCKPARLNVVFQSGADFTGPVGWPLGIVVNVTDDCGTAMATGSVVASFSNGDAPLSLVGDGTGRWSTSWTPISNAGRTATVTARASQPDIGIAGQQQVTGLVVANPGVPAITPGGVVDAASFSASASPAGGQYISIFGAQFSDALTQAQSLPLPTELGDLSFVIGGRPVPLNFGTANQVNAILPYGLPVGTTQMIAIRGTRLSTPVPVPITAGEPGVFTTSGTGQGQGHVYLGGLTLADAANAVKAGDVLVVYCTGLGEVDPPVLAGSPAPFDVVRNTKNGVLVTIGGVPAPVVFAGLTAGFAGLYQINVRVPAGVAGGSAVPLVLQIGAALSPPVTIAVQ